MTQQDELLREAAVAVMLDVSVDCLRQWRRAGKGPTFCRPGGTAIRYRRSDVLAYLKSVESGEPDDDADCCDMRGSGGQQ